MIAMHDSPRIGLLCLAALWLMPVPPAAAYKWPGTGASPGAAISAKVIGKNCPAVLTAAEIAELEAYIARAISELEERAKETPSSRPFSYRMFASNLEADYERSFKDGRPCDADATEEAQDIVGRVRKAMASGAPLYPPPAR
jgi:hypothetical protein